MQKYQGDFLSSGKKARLRVALKFSSNHLHSQVGEGWKRDNSECSDPGEIIYHLLSQAVGITRDSPV